MEKTIRVSDKEKATEIVNNIKCITNPRIDFILTRQLNYTKEYLIVITDNHNSTDRYIIKTHKKTKSLHIENLCFSLNNVLDNCIERYMLSCIDNGYHISYVSLFMHIDLWEFIEAYLGDLESLMEGVKKYLHYCEHIGVTKDLIDYYGESFHEELYAIFLNGYFENYEILLSQVIGNERLLLGYQIQSKQIIYSVIAFDEETNKKSYKELYSKLDSAKNDFRRLLYDLSIIYYKEIEENIDKTSDSFVNFIEEVL